MLRNARAGPKVSQPIPATSAEEKKSPGASRATSAEEKKLRGGAGRPPRKKKSHSALVFDGSLTFGVSATVAAFFFFGRPERPAA